MVLWRCDTPVTTTGDLIDYVPEGASVVFKISEVPDPETGFTTFTSDVNSNTVLSEIQKKGLFKGLSERANLLKHLTPTAKSIVCITETNTVSDVTFITRLTSKLFTADSIPNKTIETITYNDKTLQKITIDAQTSFTTIKDSVFIASTSQAVLQGILDGKTEKSNTFKKVFSINNGSDFTAITKGEKVTLNDSLSVDFTSWTAMSITVLQDGITATGVSIANDSVPQVLAVFKGQVPQQNNIAAILPTEATAAYSFTFSDAELLQKKLQVFKKDSTKLTTTGLFGSVNEVGHITLSEGNAIVLKSIDPMLTDEALARFVSEKNTFREIDIRTFSEPKLFRNAFYPLISTTLPTLAFQLDDFFVFTENEATAEQLISAYKNNGCLDKSAYYEMHQSELAAASSFVLFKMQGAIPTNLSGFFTTSESSEHNISLKKYPLAVLQYSYDRDFAHVNFVSEEASEKKQTTGTVSEDFNVKFTNQLLGDPQFFSNHKTNQEDIVVQDMTNALFFISSNGKVLWKEKLDGPILGTITEVDLLRNGKKQLAFTTKHTFYILDRTGKAVAPFPIKFKDPITQPLSVFDYDNNRKYRFIVTQNEEVFMYDSEGKAVKGFTFKKTKTPIVLSPQHIRLGNKDYIAIAEESGKLNLLSRVGKSRVTVSKNFQFSEIPIQKEGSNFVVITKDHKKESISQAGKVTSLPLQVSDNYHFAMMGSTKVTLDDNLLRINGRLVELPFGVYTQPKLFLANRNTYVSITETQQNKVYLFKKDGELISGFPVFGSASASVEESSKKGKLILVVKGDAKEILKYTIQ
ncbi:hypothetical protein GCM10008083_10220 [Ulvibacter litoralis]|nr:hypothetical protein GCM10008083_10220 [Ulvibacter litoralis]